MQQELSTAKAAGSSSLKQRVINFFHNSQVQGFLISVVVMAAISFLFFFPDNIEGNSLQQHDMVQGASNGHELVEYQAQTGHKAWWTNSLFSGMPAFQISPAYASNSLFSWITTVYGLGLPAPSNLLFMMMLGMLILLMAMRIRWQYALLGAIAWGLSSYFVIIIGAGHIWKFVTLAYIPPTLAGLMLAYRGKLLSGGAMAALFTMMQISANHIQMTYYFGFLIAAIIIAYLVQAIRARQYKPWLKSTGIFIVATLLGILANLPNLYHTSRYAKETQRAATEIVDPTDPHAEKEAKDARYNWITQYSYGKMETFTLMIPNVKGGATFKQSLQRQNAGQPSVLLLTDLDNGKEKYSESVNNILFDLGVQQRPVREQNEIINVVAQNVNQMYGPQYFGEPESTSGPVYVGVIIVALFIVGCIIVKGPLKWALLIATLLSIGLAWGRNFPPLTDLFLSLVPMYDSFRTPESILVVAQLCMPLLAVMALVTLVVGREDNQLQNAKTISALYIGFGIVGLFTIIGCLAPSFYGLENASSLNLLDLSSDPDWSIFQPEAIHDSVLSVRASIVRADSLRSLLFLAIAFGIIFIWMKGWLKQASVMTGTLIALVAIDLYTVDKRYVDHDSFIVAGTILPKENIEVKATQADLEILRDKDPHYRVMDLDRFSSAEPSYFHHSVGGYHAAKLGRYDDLINTPEDPKKPQGGTFITNPYVISMLNTRYIVQGGQVIENPDAMGNAWWISSVEYKDNPWDELHALSALTDSSTVVADSSFADLIGSVTAPAEGDYITLTDYAPDRLTYRYHKASDGVAAFSEVYFPWGWEATVDGEPVEIARVNYILRAIHLPAGDHELVMTFNPKSVAVTTNIAYAAIALIYLWVIFALVRAGRLIYVKCRVADVEMD